jgi:hypothetical protein
MLERFLEPAHSTRRRNIREVLRALIDAMKTHWLDSPYLKKLENMTKNYD